MPTGRYTRTEEHKKQTSKTVSKLWQNPAYRARILKAQSGLRQYDTR